LYIIISMTIFLTILLIAIVLILVWALFGKEETAAVKEKPRDPDVLLRRRAADREIEQSFPDEKQHVRRKTDLDTLDRIREVEDNFKLPYTTDEIIPEASRFRIYRRTLINAEIYAKKGDFNTAISLYEGVNSRLNDLETNHKIEADINYLRQYREQLIARKKREETIEPSAGKKTRELKLSLDGPLTIPDRIQIGLTAPIQQTPVDVDKIVDEITKKLREANLIGQAAEGDAGALKSELERLEKKVDEISEAERRPSVIEAKYESPIPIQIDPKPILDILEKIPETMDRFKKDEVARRADAARREETEELKTITEKHEEAPDEWDLLSQYGKEETPLEDMTDEDIFMKILTDDKKKGKDEFEIRGDTTQEQDYYDDRDAAVEAKRREDQKFYEKFLQHHRRKVKELPILKVSYDFSKLPDEFSLAREKNILEYSYYKYKPMLERAQEFIKKRRVKDAINYFKVVMSQNIPPEFKIMIRKNIGDLTDYLEKYLSSD